MELIKISSKELLKFRNIIELSCMINNGEFVIYTNNKLYFGSEEIKQLQNEEIASFFKNPTLILSRPVFQIESEGGLNTTFYGPLHKEHSPKITQLLDAYFKIKAFTSYNSTISPSVQLAMYIGTSYYDCMSGGCPRFELSLLKYLCEHSSVNRDEKVYPKDVRTGMWITINDFLNEMREKLNTDFEIEIKKLLPYNNQF